MATAYVRDQEVTVGAYCQPDGVCVYIPNQHNAGSRIAKMSPSEGRKLAAQILQACKAVEFDARENKQFDAR